MAKTYVVKGLCALVNVEGGFAQMLQRGALVPSNVLPDHLEHLLAQGLVEEGQSAGGLEPVYTGDLSKTVTAPVAQDVGQPVTPDPSDDPDGPGPIPAKSANKDAWVAYAVSQRAEGADEATANAEAEALTKEALIAQYGSA